MAAPSAAAALKDRIRAEASTLLDNASNLAKGARVHEAGDLPGAARVPGDLLEVFADKALGAAAALLAVAADLKRNALLSDVAGRNAEVAAARGARGGGAE